MNSNEMLLDDTFLDGKQRSVQLPTLRRRLGAALIDAFFCGALSATVLPFNFNNLVSQIISALIPLFYKVLMEGLKDGQTIGKMALAIQVVQDDPNYSSISLENAFKRTSFWIPVYLITILSLVIQALYGFNPPTGLENFCSGGELVAGVLYLGSILSIFYNKRNRTWYDRYAGTICIVVQKQGK